MALRVERKARKTPARSREQREDDIRDYIAAKADELWADYVKPRDEPWVCPACAQVDRIQGRLVEEEKSA
jgi:hypothetical protein